MFALRRVEKDFIAGKIKKDNVYVPADTGTVTTLLATLAYPIRSATGTRMI